MFNSCSFIFHISKVNYFEEKSSNMPIFRRRRLYLASQGSPTHETGMPRSSWILRRENGHDAMEILTISQPKYRFSGNEKHW